MNSILSSSANIAFLIGNDFVQTQWDSRLGAVAAIACFCGPSDAVGEAACSLWIFLQMLQTSLLPTSVSKLCS